MSEPFGIYVHWPFCAAKCPYCDFNSHVRAALEPMEWARAITFELEHAARWQGDQRPAVRSVFFGGGTPSLMPGRAAGLVLETITRLWNVTNDWEVTLEANPASADAARFADYRAAGVNRLSLGLQALNDADLKFLGRLHTADEARAALGLAQRSFDRVSLDLIYARPGQSMAAWADELRVALAFGTEHVSLYQLTIEEATPFAARARAGELLTAPEGLAVELYEATQAICEAAGLPAYEISNHARPGAECRHNLLYWNYGLYAGVGPGAHGRLAIDGARLATMAEKLPERWQARVAEHGHGLVHIEPLAADDIRHEHLLMQMRLRDGLDMDDYAQRWGMPLDGARITALMEAGFLTERNGRLAATPQGRLVLNRLIAELAD